MYGKLHGIEIPAVIAQNGNPTTNVCMCGRWRVTLNYCKTEMTIPTTEGILVFDISLESLSNTEVTIPTTEGILVFDVSLKSLSNTENIYAPDQQIPDPAFVLAMLM